MSKELEAFYKVKDKLIKVEGKTTYGSILDLTNLDIIETALKDYEETDNQIYDLFDNFGINHRKDLLKKLKALAIIINIIKQTGCFIFAERRSFGKVKPSYFLIIRCGASECEYKFKDKAEFDSIREVCYEIH